MNKIEIENLVLLMQEKWANIVLEIGKAYRNKTNVDDPPAVTTLVAVLPVPALLTEDFVFILKVFAILS